MLPIGTKTNFIITCVGADPRVRPCVLSNQHFRHHPSYVGADPRVRPCDYFCTTENISPTTIETRIKVPIAIVPIIPSVESNHRIKNTHNICLNGDPRLEASQITIPKIRSL